MPPGEYRPRRHVRRSERTLRSFLHQATGAGPSICKSVDWPMRDLAAAAPLLARLDDAQFNAERESSRRHEFSRAGVDPLVDLKWWPVALVGSTCFVAVVALAALLSMTAARRQLRPLANVERLTQLPEYAKAARLRSVSTVITLVVLTVMFGAATWAGARPAEASADFDAAHPRGHHVVRRATGDRCGDGRTARLLRSSGHNIPADPTHRPDIGQPPAGAADARSRITPRRDSVSMPAPPPDTVGDVRTDSALHGLCGQRRMTFWRCVFPGSPVSNPGTPTGAR